MADPQIVISPGGDELAVIPRAEYEAYGSAHIRDQSAPCRHEKKEPESSFLTRSAIRPHLACYSMICATTPAPTVRPPSRMAKRSFSSIAIGTISCDFHRNVVARHHHFRALGERATPVTSVVRK